MKIADVSHCPVAAEVTRLKPQGFQGRWSLTSAATVLKKALHNHFIKCRWAFLVLALIWTTASLQAATNLSVWAFPGSTGRMIQQPDALGNRVLDFSGVGYRGGTVPISEVPVKLTISPVAGDNTVHLQNAINQVGALPLDTNGFRGALLLLPGEYPLSNTVNITASGVVLRGSGNGTNGTILRATAGQQYTLINLIGSGSETIVSGTTHTITNYYVPVGARSCFVDSTSGLAVGDRVYVQNVATVDWIHDMGMDLLCCEPAIHIWTPPEYTRDYDRFITHIQGNQVFVDAPLPNAIDAGYTNGTIRKFTWSGLIQNVGIEHLRGVSDYTNSVDENHGWTFVAFTRVDHGWARDLVSKSFGYCSVQLSRDVRNVTVADCQALDPVSQITGGRRYAFIIERVALCLVKNCYTRQDRHQFVTQAYGDGPNAFVDGLSDDAKADAGPHHRWNTGTLWDSVTVNGNNLNSENRGNNGSGHGWAGGNEVIWNAQAAGFSVQNPPGARNWLIGSIGPIQNGTAYVGPHDPGTYDSSGATATNVFPQSLYYAQLQDRLAAPNLQTRDYWLGDVDGFTNKIGSGFVPVDAAWRTAVQAAAGSQPLDSFDVLTGNHWVPFTFNFSLATTQRVVAATLSISLVATGNASNDVLCLGAVTNTFTFAALGWLPIATALTNPSVRVLDLSDQLDLLAAGKLNVLVRSNTAIDWAMLELQIAPVMDTVTNVLVAEADAYVRDGTYATNNFGSDGSLAVKNDGTSYQRKTYFRWNLASVTGQVVRATVRLTPTTVGINGMEHGLALVNSNNWGESTITWSNQPGAGKRFATWLPAVNVPLECVVTPQVLESLAADKKVSLQVYSLRNLGGTANGFYASRESSNPAQRPQLLIETRDYTPAPPLLVSPALMNGRVQLTVYGDPGYRLTIQTSANLSTTNWVNVLVTNLPPLPFIWNDPVSSTGSARFYRALMGP